MHSYDVVILGGGIAGSFVARHLKLARPALSVLVLEARSVIDDFKVGESTVEVAANYMVRRMRLGPYLYQHQLPKNGLRFFFDREDKSLPLTEMSEIGSDHMPFHPSFQLDRAALERDLVAMNRAIGVEVTLGAKVVRVGIDAASQHTIAYEKAGETHEVAARWVIDASGRRHLLHRSLGLPIHKETRINTAAAWGRMRGIAGLDAVEDEAFRARVRYTSRHLSTNHLMYDGYWIWFIPLAGDVMSVGVVYDKDRVEGPRTEAALMAFLKEHRAARDLIGDSTFDDFQSYAHLPYTVDKFFSTDRWAVTGEAGAFVDPFYSPGSDFIATSNELIVALVLAEMEGDAAAFAEKVEAYDAFYRFKYESTVRLYEKLYPTFGSFEVFRLKYLLDFHNYYNLVVWPFFADRLTDVAWIREELDFADRVTQVLSKMADHFVRMSDVLRERGEYFAQNQGRWANGLCGVGQLEGRLGPAIDETFRRAEVGRAFGHVLAAVLERVLDQDGLSRRERVLSELDFRQVLFFRELDDATYQRLLKRLAARLTSDLRAEFPEATAVRATLDSGPLLRLSGLPEGDVAVAIAARASAMWDAEGASLPHAEM